MGTFSLIEDELGVEERVVAVEGATPDSLCPGFDCCRLAISAKFLVISKSEAAAGVLFEISTTETGNKKSSPNYFYPACLSYGFDKSLVIGIIPAQISISRKDEC